MAKYSKPQTAIYVWLLEVVIVLAFVSVLVWLCLQPKTPTYTVFDFYVPAMDNQNSTSLSSANRNTSLVFNFEISNPNNGIGIYYDQANVTLHLGDQVIGGSSIPCFYQGHKKTARREASVNSTVQFWKEDFRMSLMNNTVDLEVQLKNEVRYRIFSWKTKHHTIDLQGSVRIASDGKMVAGVSAVLLYEVQ